MRMLTPGAGRPALSRRHRSGVLHRVRRDDGYLARAVGGQPPHPDATGDGARHLLGHRRRAPHDVAQRGQVEVFEPRVVGHAERDRRHRHLERHAFLLDGAQRRVEVEARVQADPRPCGHRGHDVEQPEDVHGWRRDLEAIAVGEPECGDPVLDRVPERAVRVAHRLGQAGRARAEHQHRVGVGIVDDVTAGSSRPTAARSSNWRTGADGSASASARHPAASPIARLRRRDPAGVLHLRGLPRRAEHHDRRAELQHAVHREHELRPVGRHRARRACLARRRRPPTTPPTRRRGTAGRRT